MQSTNPTGDVAYSVDKSTVNPVTRFVALEPNLDPVHSPATTSREKERVLGPFRGQPN